MQDVKEIKAKIVPHFRIVIDAEDGTPPRVWKLCYTYRALVRLEEATGLDLKKFDNWKNISSGKHFPQIIWAGLEKYNPEVTIDEVKDVLNPEVQRLLSDEIFALMFPGVKEAYEKSLKEGDTSPNVQAETTT